jgi:hypothetical protein
MVLQKRTGNNLTRIPNRLIWNNWERFNGEQDNPGDSTDYNIPLIAVKPEVNSVADYFGLPLGKTMNVCRGPFSIETFPIIPN